MNVRIKTLPHKAIGWSETNIHGWQIADSANGTPNLKDKYLMGASATHPLGSTGGATSYTSINHTHSINLHTTYGIPDVTSVQVATSYYNDQSLPTGDAGLHLHSSITSEAAGANITKGEPPYYAMNHIVNIHLNIRSKLSTQMRFFVDAIQDGITADSTPNGRFIVGTGSNHVIKSKGGSSTVGAHSHSINGTFTTISWTTGNSSSNNEPYMDSNSSTKLSFIYGDSNGNNHTIGAHSHTCPSSTSANAVTVLPNYITKIFAFLSGPLNTRGAIPKGVILGYLGDTAPDGWTLLTDTADRLIQANSTANQAGGNLRGSHGHSVGDTGVGTDPNAEGVATSGKLITTINAAGTHVHKNTYAAGNNLFDVDTWPPYYAVNFIKKV